MSKDSPSPTERKLLNIIYRYISEHGELPNSRQLVDDFDSSGSDGNTLSNLNTVAKRLEKNGFIEKRGNLFGITKKTERYFSSISRPIRPNSVVPTQVQIIGTVKAGKTIPEELEVDIRSNGEFIILPETKLEKNTYALQVTGKSMEHEGIFDGDFVIVEEYDGLEWPQHGELIVTKYYPLDSEKENQADDIPESDFMDLTLKVYSEQFNSNKKVYRLGWKKDNQSNTYVISASRLIPKGKVIGVYRNLRTSKFSS